MNSLFLYTFYVVFASFLVIFVFYKYFRFIFWKKTEGQILERNIERVKEIVRYETYKPVIKYKYFVNGKEYVSDRIFITPFETDKNTANKIVEEFKSDKVTVYYNPFNPAESVLKKSVHAGLIVMVIALLGIMLPFLYMAFVEIHGFGYSADHLSQKIKNILHSLFDK
ncbi:MAG: DUF3592 domain-containing protein [Sulfurihydrogenibium sp.]|nr:MAG: DUF3592 domain-containing protein [Sulfurihydrogenibium sp.]